MFERPRGTRDFDHVSLAKQRHVEQSLRATALRYGFREILTPTFETVELFKARSGPGIVDEMFTFTDKGGRELALRPEFTASIMRFYLEELRTLQKPLKLFTIGNCFRYEEPQKGRHREFWQWNCEVVGASSLDADAETVALAVAGLKAVGLKQTETRIGHIGMLRNALKFEPAQQASILHFLDKRQMDGLQKELERIGAGDLFGVLAAVIGLKGGPEVLDQAQSLLGEAAKESVEYLRMLGDQLGMHGVTDFVYDLGVVRGLDYYSGMVFEIDSPNLGAERQVGGGGAYSLAEAFGGERIPSTGFAMGIDRVVLAAEQEGIEMGPPPLTAFVVPIGEQMRRKGYEVLRSLRESGLSADIDLQGRGPSKNLDYANSIGVKYVVLVGEREEKKGVVALRDMTTGNQVEVSFGDLVTAIAGVPRKRPAMRKERAAPKKKAAARSGRKTRPHSKKT